MTPVESVVQAVLYEGYMLYPYRPSSVKNRQRWTFGGVYPHAYSQASGSDPWLMQSEFLIRGDGRTRIGLRPGFLQVIERIVLAGRRAGFRCATRARGAEARYRRPPLLPMAGSCRAAHPHSGDGAWRTARCAARDSVLVRRGQRSRDPHRSDGHRTRRVTAYALPTDRAGRTGRGAGGRRRVSRDEPHPQRNPANRGESAQTRCGFAVCIGVLSYGFDG
jgi:hypothetical protein